MLWALKQGIFQIFSIIWVTKLKSFSGKVRPSVENCLNLNLVIGSLLGNRFEATLSSKTKVLSIWKVHYSVFCKYLRDEIKTIFWESGGKRWKLFNSKFGHRKILKKWFWSYLELKNESFECLKRALFRFLQIFEKTKLKAFSGKVRQSLENCLSQNLVLGSLLGNGFEATLSAKTNVLSVSKEQCSVFWKFMSETVFWEG